jgi:outer membrane protein OmpA-like peptidoglycan-associated protein
MLKIMNKIKYISVCMLAAVFVIAACKSMSKTQKGAAVGTVGGAAAGAIVGRASGNTALGAIIGATVGGVTGAIIGRKMDKQAEEMKKEIPNATVERVGEGIVVEFNDKILFGFDSYELSSTATGNLDKLVDVLKKYEDTDIEVQGHTDSKGTTKYNQTLSEKRASSVTNYLKGKGIADSRLTSKGYGETAPKYSNDTEDGRSKNRCVEFHITANEKMKEEAKKEAN